MCAVIEDVSYYCQVLSPAYIGYFHCDMHLYSLTNVSGLYLESDNPSLIDMQY